MQKTYKISLNDKNLNLKHNDTFKKVNGIKLILKNDITKINKETFLGVNIKKITNLHKLNKLTSIEYGAFYNCNKLTEISLPNSITTLGESCFCNCTNLKKINLSNNILDIPKDCFKNCDNLSTLKLPKKLKSISAHAFNKCGLTKIKIPNSVESLGDLCFLSCDKLKSVKLPDTLESIPYCCFADCKNLKHIILPKSLKYISNDAFCDCKKLRNVFIPDSVNKLGFLPIENSSGEIFYSWSNQNNFSCKSLNCPLTYINDLYFESFKKIKKCKLRFKNEILSIKDIKTHHCGEYSTTYVLNDGRMIICDIDGKKTEITKSKLLEKNNENNKLALISINNYGKIINWLKYDKIPNRYIVLNMPPSQIEAFYQKHSQNNWLKILKKANCKDETFICTLFKIANVLGVFCNSSKDSDLGTEYILKYILSVYSHEEINEKFSKFNSFLNPFNKKFTEFFMLYFKYLPNFLVRIYRDIHSGEEIHSFDYLAYFHNHFTEFLNILELKYSIYHTNNYKIYFYEAFDYLENLYYEFDNDSCNDYYEIYSRIIDSKNLQLVNFIKNKVGEKINDTKWLLDNEWNLLLEYESKSKNN